MLKPIEIAQTATAQTPEMSTVRLLTARAEQESGVRHGAAAFAALQPDAWILDARADQAASTSQSRVCRLKRREFPLPREWYSNWSVVLNDAKNFEQEEPRLVKRAMPGT